MNTLAINGRQRFFAIMLAASLAISAFSASYFVAAEAPVLVGESAHDVG